MRTGETGRYTKAFDFLSFGFNSTLTSSFTSVQGGQALCSLRLDFTDGIAPPTSRNLLAGPVFINNGVPVALGTPVAVTSIPEPSTLVSFCVAMAGLVLW